MLDGQLNFLRRFLKSTDFFKAVQQVFIIVLPIVAASFFDQIPVGVGMALGVLYCFPSDVPGNSKHRMNGMFCAIGFSVVGTILGGMAAQNVWLSLPLIVLCIFLFSYISVYGFRASLISFSGLLSFVLGYAAIGMENQWLHLLYIVLGGLWYILASSVFLKFGPKTQVVELLVETMKLTVNFMDLKKQWLLEKQNRSGLVKKQFELQSKISEKHEQVRETLLNHRKHFGRSNTMRRQLLIFISLVDLFELVISSPANLGEIDEIVGKEPQTINLIEKILSSLSAQLNHIADAFSDHKNIASDPMIPEYLKTLEDQISAARKSVSEENPGKLWTAHGLLENEKKCYEIIKSMERISEKMIDKNTFSGENKELNKFITPTDYRFEIFRENFSLSAPIFRHSLRLLVLMLIGIVIGKLFVFQNAYWILLTLVVIMRPSYGLTKERSKKRILGTLIGAVVAVGIVLWTKDPVIYGILAIISLILGYAFIQKNYVGAAAFITLNVVFVYALLLPDTLSVIQFRVVDTAIGGGLAFLGNFLLWPSWERHGIEKFMIASLKANAAFLKEIAIYFHHRSESTTAYKLARKQAFLKMGDLSAAFQRMAQEPKSQQKKLGKLYRFCALNQTFLTSLAGLGTYVRNHQSAEASVYFETEVPQILRQLEITMTALEKENNLSEKNSEGFKSTDEPAGEGPFSKIPEAGTREAHVISEQLKWLREVSLKLTKVG